MTISSEPLVDTPDESSSIIQFDFDSHGQRAVESYRAVSSAYEAFATTVRDILVNSFRQRGLFVHSIEARGKSLASFEAKARTPSEEDPNQPAYPDPLANITDLAGIRVITFFLDLVDTVDEVVVQQFEVIEKSNKGKLLEDEDKLGYQSVHYLLRLTPSRCVLPEYEMFRSLVAELQVRTILQHAWAEIEHDIQYKSVETLPSTIRRRFMSLAGLLEIADREFQAIEHQHADLRAAARASVTAGNLHEVEITPDSLRTYLDQRMGPDGRMSEWSYTWAARMLLRLGFTDLAQVESCITGYDDDQISRILWGNRQGQIQRFEDTLLAAMGRHYIERHPWAVDPNMSEWRPYREQRLTRLRDFGIETREYDPQTSE